MIAGKRHLVYEVHLTNFKTIDIALTLIRVMDPDRSTHLAEYTGSDLTARLGHPGLVHDPQNKRIISPGMRAVIYFWVALNEETATPERLRHQIEYEVARSTGREQDIVETAGVNVCDQAPVVLDPPLRGGPWVALYDPMMQHGHRTSIYALHGRARIPARFAIDWILLNDDATHAHGDESNVGSWHGYGVDVLAVRDAVVVEAKNDIPEHELISASQEKMALENASGNYVTLDLANGNYAFYEHLQYGSIRVKPGDRIKSGEVIARLGNSGSSSSGPHLHFHVSDDRSPLAAEGKPYVFRNFEVLGAFPTIDAFGKGQNWNAVPDPEGGRRSMELPAPNVVLMLD